MQRTANLLLLALLAIGGLLLALLALVVAMFAETLVPHVLEFCLLAWHALTLQLTYRVMFIGLVVLALTAAAFILQVWRRARLTLRHVKELLQWRVPPSLSFACVLNELELAECVDLVEFAQPLAFCYGWRRPRILVTTGLLQVLTPEELSAVLAHEKYHLAHRDPLKILLVRAMREAIVFLPILRDLVDNYLAAQEIAADESVTHLPDARDALTCAIYKLGRHPHAQTLSVGAFTPLARRVRHLVNPGHAFALYVSVRRLLVSAVLAFALVWVVLHPLTPMPLAHALDADCHASGPALIRERF